MKESITATGSTTATMSDIPTTPEALTAWIEAHRIDEVECILPDQAGVAKGKVMPAEKFAKFNPVFLPITVFLQCITGSYAEIDEDWLSTEYDLLLKPDLNTARLVPWTKEPSLQIIHDMFERDGTPVGMAPRNVLRRVIELYRQEGWQPVIAPEMEFYLTKPNTDSDYPVEPPVGRSGRQGIGRQAYSISAVDEFEELIEDIYGYADAQRIDIDTIIHEAGAAQLEFNFEHGDPLLLADQVFVFKRTIREAAQRHGIYATFMAKPMEDEPGSAMHIHQSVIDAKSGTNIFSDPEGEPTPAFHGFIGGQQGYLRQATCMLAHYVNSYRRLVPDKAAPINLAWGMDNRSAGLRIPTSAPNARRVENRVVGADANPYLAIAASLACGYLGMKEGLKPTAPTSESAYEQRHDLPRDLREALETFEACKPVRDVLGEEFSRIYLTIKRHELQEFMRVVSPWEREHLMLNV
ncbi:MAG: glutamine synthetase family protein [Geminicoccaceae bacterium]